ncbi:MAG: S-methyl-5-thioribose-1-phosphate isomerase [Prochlorothrix sp.]|nr:S-methyl-5-thioribose-1-phosphate isomerase [Prochlorothrix sp.]
MANVLNLPETLSWEAGEFFLLDQTQLPLATVVEKQETVEQVWDSIKRLKVRGAPAIGVAGAYGLVLSVQHQTQLDRPAFLAELERQAAYLDSARPTAVNLHWALTRMLNKAKDLGDLPVPELYQQLEAEAIQIHNEDRQLCRRIGEHGQSLIQPNMGVLTHCNAGSLATAELGTALAPMYLAHQAGVPFKVYADETRPLLQGARLTTWELQQAGVDVTLICDNMAAHLMSQGLINLVIVGTDRVAANGDVANKIGTLGVAILADYFKIPFYVACPYSTIDFDTPTGSDIVIEERGEEEVTHFGLKRTAPEGMGVRNPAFDVTPYHLVAGLITERGIVRAPFGDQLKQVYSR